MDLNSVLWNVKALCFTHHTALLTMLQCKVFYFRRSNINFRHLCKASYAIKNPLDNSWGCMLGALSIQIHSSAWKAAPAHPLSSTFILLTFGLLWSSLKCYCLRRRTLMSDVWNSLSENLVPFEILSHMLTLTLGCDTHGGRNHICLVHYCVSATQIMSWQWRCSSTLTAWTQVFDIVENARRLSKYMVFR